MKTAKEFFKALEKEFQQGSPESKLNKRCKTYEDLIFYAMEEFASISVDAAKEAPWIDAITTQPPNTNTVWICTGYEYAVEEGYYSADYYGSGRPAWFTKTGHKKTVMFWQPIIKKHSAPPSPIKK